MPQKRPSPTAAHAKRPAPPSALASSKGKARAVEPPPDEALPDSEDEGRFEEIDVDPEVLAAFDRAADEAHQSVALPPPPPHQSSMTATTISAGPRASPSAPASPVRPRQSVSAPELAPAAPVADGIVEDLLRAWRNKADMVDQLLEHFEGQAESDLDEIELSLCVRRPSGPG